MQVLEERAGETQRQLLLAQSELKAAREDAHIHELNKSQLQAQLAGNSIPAAALHTLHTFMKAVKPSKTLNHSSCTAHVNAISLPKGFTPGIGSVLYIHFFIRLWSAWDAI